MNVDISITEDNATAAIAELMARTKPARLAAVCRQPLETFWRQRLKDFPRLPGKFAAFPDTGFGESASRSVIGMAQGDRVLLSANQLGLLLRYLGGTIKAVIAKCLCFPVTEDAYGKSVWDFGYRPGAKDKAVNEKIRANFAFARQITFRPNPAIVPSADEFQEVAMGAIQRSLAA